MGDKRKNMETAIRLLQEQAGEVLSESSLYATEPWGLENQDDFVNQAVLISTQLQPDELLQKILSIELQMGRRREQKWGPRLIDIDILDYAGLILHTNDLTLPHPFLHERMFTLMPLKQVSPGWIHPVLNKNIDELIAGCPDKKSVEALS